MTAELQGFAKFVREGIIVRAGLSLALNITVKVGNINETVEVKAETPLLEASTAVQAVNVATPPWVGLPPTALTYVSRRADTCNPTANATSSDTLRSLSSPFGRPSSSH